MSKAINLLKRAHRGIVHTEEMETDIAASLGNISNFKGNFGLENGRKITKTIPKSLQSADTVILSSILIS